VVIPRYADPRASLAWDILGWSQESRDTKYSRTPLTWDNPGSSQESWDTKYSRIHWLHSHGTSRGWSQESRDTKYLDSPHMGHPGDHPRNPGILSIPGSTGSTHMGHPGDGPRNPRILSIWTPLTWDNPGSSQESWDTKYSRIHWLHSHRTSQDGSRNPGILSIPGLPSHGTSRDHPRNPGILSIPGSMGSPVMGHPRMVPGILGY